MVGIDRERISFTVFFGSKTGRLHKIIHERRDANKCVELQDGFITKEI